MTIKNILASSNLDFCDNLLSQVPVGELTHQQFGQTISGLVESGIRNGLSQEFIADQVLTVIKDNPRVTQELGFPTEFSAVKTKLVQPYFETHSTTQPQQQETLHEPRFIPRPNHPSGGFWVGANNKIVSTSDATGASDMLMRAFGNAYLTCYALLAAGAAAGPVLGFAARVAPSIPLMAESAWATVVGTPGAIATANWATEILDGWSTGTPLPTSDAGYVGYVANNLWEHIIMPTWEKNTHD